MNKLERWVELVPALLPQGRDQFEQACCLRVECCIAACACLLVDLIDDAIGVMGAELPFEPCELVDGGHYVGVSVIVGAIGDDMAGPAKNMATILGISGAFCHWEGVELFANVMTQSTIGYSLMTMLETPS